MCVCFFFHFADLNVQKYNKKKKKCKKLHIPDLSSVQCHITAPIHIATHVNFVLHAVDVIPVVYNNIKRRSHKKGC